MPDLDTESAAMNQRFIGVPEQVLKFAPKQKLQWMSPGTPSLPCCKRQPTYRTTIMTAPEPWQMSFHVSFALPMRINQLETEIEHFRDRAIRAETWLQLIQREIEEKLIAPMATTRPKSTT
jgi:hypothetical protein